jgi:hypothetical protein
MELNEKLPLNSLMNDPETNCIVMIGEIGGQPEADAAKDQSGLETSYWIPLLRNCSKGRNYNTQVHQKVGMQMIAKTHHERMWNARSPAEIGKK